MNTPAVTTTLTATLHTTPDRRAPMPIAAAASTPPDATHTEKPPMTTARLTSTLDSPANDVAPPASPCELALVAMPPLNPHGAAPRAGATSPAMPTANAVQTRTPRTPSPEPAMPTIHTFKRNPVPSLTLVHSAPAVAVAETSSGPTCPRPRVLASQVSDVALKELAFYFGTGADDDVSARARRAIARWLATLSDRDQDALSLYFDPAPWPASIRRAGVDYQRGYALVLAHASPNHRWPASPQRPAHLRRASVQLEVAVQKHGPRVLRHLTRHSEWTFASALRAYVKARGRTPSVLGPMGPGSKEAP